MSKIIKIHENDIYMSFKILDNNTIRLINFSVNDMNDNDIPINLQNAGKLVELQESGRGSADHRGMKHVGSVPGSWLQYISFHDCKNEIGRKLEIVQEDHGLRVVSHIQFYADTNTIRSWTTLHNTSTEIRHIEYVSSFAYYLASFSGKKQWKDKMRLYQGHNSWYDEARWESHTLPELGLNPIDFMSSTKRIYEYSVGTWSSSEYLPMGCLTNEESMISYLWQIESNGSWYWEVGDTGGDFFESQEAHGLMITTEGTAPAEIYFQLSGPTEQECHWHKILKPNDVFETVPVAVAVAKGRMEDALGELVTYRRKIRRPNDDNEKLGVIFNDYMNCLFGDSTTSKLLPLIDSAANAGCEYFCIDCGWYTENNWWAGVGEWMPSEERYPGGIQIPLQYIRSKGMIPGLWLEIEVMGLDCPGIDKIPVSWFFQRYGKPVIDQCRYQLDFRNPEVVTYATKIIDRLVNDFGVGYIKMDYNINAGLGTEVASDSLGDGLLEHNRAYLRWLDSMFAKYPELIIENCGSGGMRMDYAMLSRHSIQSSSDQTDYIKNAAIAVSSPMAVNPEQCAIWSYPLATADREEVAFNMVNAILLRIHQSGHLAQLPKVQFDLVKEGIDIYKKIRKDIKTSTPFWPIGIPEFTDDYFVLGEKCEDAIYLAVWRISGDDTKVIPIKYQLPADANVTLLYPSFSSDRAEVMKEGSLKVSMKTIQSARLFKINY